MNALRISAVSAAALLAACGLGGPQYPSFEQASYRIEGSAANPDGGAAIPTVIYRDGAKMRVETNVGAIVFDRATNAAYVLSAAPAPAVAATTTTAPGQTATTTTTPGAASTTTTTPPAAGAPAATTSTTTTTPPASTTTTVAAPAAAPTGVAIRVADADAPQPMETPWAALGAKGARAAGDCEVAGEKGHNWRPRQSDHVVERTACITQDGIVLRVTEGDAVIFEATRLDRGAQDPALFGVPANYTVVDPEAVVQQVGETMEQLDSVTGEPATPATAPSAQPRG